MRWKLERKADGSIAIYAETEGSVAIIECTTDGKIVLRETPQYGGKENLAAEYANICAAIDAAESLT